MSKPTLLIVGARKGSLGQAVLKVAHEWGDYRNVHTAGINGEGHRLDITNSEHIKDVLRATNPDHVVCTVGVNEPLGVFDPFLQSLMTDAFRTNVIGPMQLLREFSIKSDTVLTRPKFVVISSNSARIPRTKSISYCASKAALSMAVRCAARELARGNVGPLVWGYEPGLLNTVMTREMFPPGDDPEHPGVPNSGPMHRMEGVDWKGIRPEDLADRIIGDLASSAVALNGTMIPFDAGEL